MITMRGRAQGLCEPVSTHVTVRPSIEIHEPKIMAMLSPMLTSAQMEKPNSKKIRAEVCMPTATFICLIQWTARSARLGSARL